jgi:DNA-binding MarR family transcriptional regulator
VQRLVDAGHLVREVDPADRRRVTLTVTRSAADLLARAYGPVADEGRRILAGYPAADLAVIDHFLRAGVDLQRAHAVRIRAIG